MNESEQISELAQNLFLMAGGRRTEEDGFYFILAGRSSDDIVGMCITDMQLDHWLELENGLEIHDLLERHKNDQDPAYTCCCYDAVTVSCIIEQASQLHKQFASA